MSSARPDPRFGTLLESIPDGVRQTFVADAEVVHLPANVPPWTELALEVEPGEAFTLFATGRVVLSEEAGLWNGPAFHLWARVGGAGPLLNGTRETGSFTSERGGRLALCVYSGEWATPDGELGTPVEGYALLTGGLDVLVVRWRGGAREGVAALADAVPDEPLFAAERERLDSEPPSPAGWHHHWLLGPSAIYRSSERDGQATIRAETSDDVGILQHPVDLPLGPDTRVGWEWCVDALPSERAEDTLPTHDYLSVAFEFENGLDLTYLWSATMPAGSHYRCPLPNWDQRETHFVIRSGSEGLGSWHREERLLLPDYREAIGEPPKRIVAAWLISVSLFQKRSGAVEYRDLWIESGGHRVQVI